MERATSVPIPEALPRRRPAWQTLLRTLTRNPTMTGALVGLVAIAAVAGVSGWVAPYDPTAIDPLSRFASPSQKHLLGTDQLGRDLLSRTLVGSRISLIVGVSIALITSVFGVLLGLLTGYFKMVDNLVMRVLDGLMAIPGILLAIALMALLGASMQNVIIALSIVYTPRTVRIVRAMVLSLREWTFVEAARAVGAPTWRILALHIFPSTVAPLIIQSTYIFATSVLTEASLSFLGAGVPPIIPSWGNIMGEGRTYIQQAPWVTFFPGLALFFTVLAINVLGDGLRDVLDPRLRRRL